MNRIRRCVAAFVGFLSCHGVLQAIDLGHSHGVAKLDVAIDNGKVSIRLSSPLDSFLGFERAPRTEAERKLADAVIGKLKDPDSLFRIDPAAQCIPSLVTISSPALHLGSFASDRHQQKEHGDVDAQFEFDCAGSLKATYIDVGLFHFPRLQRLDVQAMTLHGQFKRELVRPTARLLLRR